MGSELMPQCGACGSRGTRKVGAETAAPAVGCHCGVIVTGFTEAEATERWERLSRRAEIGARVEQVLKAKLHVGVNRKPMSDGSSVYTTFLFDEGVQYAVNHADSILDALRSLAAKLEELTDE